VSDTDPLEFARKTCEQLANASQGTLSWDWDGRSSTAVAAFESDVDEAMQVELTAHFDTRWTSQNLGEAPERVNSVASLLGGLRGNQLLWVSSPDAPAMLFCAWWPWGNGTRVSIRIGYDAPNGGSHDGTDLKSWFGI